MKAGLSLFMLLLVLWAAPARAEGIKLDEFRERLRKVLPERVIPWLAHRLEVGGGEGGLPRDEARQQAALSTFGFEPGDIVTQVMSFGASRPIAVRRNGRSKFTYQWRKPAACQNSITLNH